MAKKTDGWMPLYVADYLADTSRLTTEQHGAYMLIIMDYWRNGAPPDDDGVLSSITKLPVQQWRKHSASLRGFFSVCDGVWVHKRIDAERQKASGITTARATSGSHGAASKWGSDAGKTSGKTPAQIRSERLAEARRKGSHTSNEWETLVDVLGRACVSCGVAEAGLVGGALCKDHITPIYQGGDDSIMNLQPMCRECNSRKGSDSSDLRACLNEKWLEEMEKRLAKRLTNGSQTPAPSPSPNTSPIGDGAPKTSFAANEPTGDNCPHQQIVGLYHQHLPSAIRVREWTPARAQALRARWREKPQRQNLEWWERFFGYIAESDFLMGRAHSNGRKPFEIDLEWICQSKNFVKIIEGKFHEAKEVAA